MPVLKIKTKVDSHFVEASEGRKYHDGKAVEDLVNYVMRADKTQGELIGGIAVNPVYAKEQFRIVAIAYGKNFGVRLRHMILSFGPKEQVSLFDAKTIAFQIALYYGWKYQIIWACHADGNCLHIHFVMNVVSYLTGEKYDGSKGDYYRFQEHINNVLAPYKCYVIAVKDTGEYS